MLSCPDLTHWGTFFSVDYAYTPITVETLPINVVLAQAIVKSIAYALGLDHVISCAEHFCCSLV